MLDEPVTLAVGQPVRIVVDEPDASQTRPRRSLVGFAKGMFEMRDDFNDPLEEFEDYM